MEYLNIPTALFSSAEFIGAEPVQRATWIALLAWCCEQENGGIIHECRSWGMRRWMQTCGVTQEEIGEGCELYFWDGNNLMVFGYPKHIQANLEVKRTIARENGKLGGRPRKTNAETNVGTNAETNVGTNAETNVGTNAETNVGTDEKPMSVSKKTDVGTEIGTEIGTNIETDIATYGKTVRKEGRKERNIIQQKTHPVNNTVVNGGDELGFELAKPYTRGHKLPLPKNHEEVKAYLQAETAKGTVALLPSQIDECALHFWATMIGVGWIDSKGRPVNNWQGTALAYAMSWQSNRTNNLAGQGNVRMDNSDLEVKWL